MSDINSIGFPEAAHKLGTTVGLLRRAIRAGRLPAPPVNTATAPLPATWLEQAKSALEASPKAVSRSFSQKVPAFARYEGTSAWRKYGNRVREFARFKAGAA